MRRHDVSHTLDEFGQALGGGNPQDCSARVITTFLYSTGPTPLMRYLLAVIGAGMLVTTAPASVKENVRAVVPSSIARTHDSTTYTVAVAHSHPDKTIAPRMMLSYTQMNSGEEMRLSACRFSGPNIDCTMFIDEDADEILDRAYTAKADSLVRVYGLFESGNARPLPLTPELLDTYGYIMGLARDQPSQ